MASIQAAPPKETSTLESREALIFGICDRLYDHGHCVTNVVLAPARPDGSPDWAKASPINLEELPDDEWPQDPRAEKRAAVLVDHVDGCDAGTSMLLFLRENDEPSIIQIAGPEADGDIAMRIIGRDVGARPAAPKEPGPLAQSFESLRRDLARPAAANDNIPDAVRRLIPFAEAYGGEIRDKTLFGAKVDGVPGQVFIDDGVQAWFYSARGTRRIDLPAKPKERFSVDWFSDIGEDMPKEEILKGVFGVDEFTMISGKPGSGKSVIATDLACHIASGMDWHGRAVKQGLVVYIAAERKALTKRRMLAFRKHHGVGDIPLMVLGGMMDFTSGVADADAVIALIKDAEQSRGHLCRWIVIDTLTRTFGPGDQNASKDMTKFVLSCDHIRESVMGSHITVIHHTGWSGDRGKGAIDLDGAVDASFLVKKEAGGYLLECDGANDGDDGVLTRFRMEGIQVGVDEDGEPTMAPVVIPHDEKTAGERLIANITGHKAKALDVLRSLGDAGDLVPQGLWRNSFYAEYPSIDNNTLKSRFKRAKDSLLADRLIVEAGGGFRVEDTGT